MRAEGGAPRIFIQEESSEGENVKRYTILVLVLLLSCSIPATAQQRISLAGYWERWIAGQLYDSIQVPSSYRPVGTARLVRSLDLPAISAGRRAILRFEGIAGNGTLRVNGHDAGTLGPYSRYDFDVTDYARAGPNQIEMEITDWQVPMGLGPTAAWESYGGIIYDAYAEIRTDPYIENARLSYTLSPDFTSGDCKLDIFVRGTSAHDVQLAADLQQQQASVSHVRQTAKVKAGQTVVSLQWKLDNVRLWSPQDPQLYTLSVALDSSHGRDVFSTETGFRSLAIKGNKFILNGHPIVFKGVARHNLYANQGYTLTGPQIEQDFQMIKSMGANSVRLVHYPHDPRDLQAAADDGIFVSEESGLTWIDFTKAPACTLETGIDNLERTVERDWNNPALFAILLANESTPTVEVMKEARQRIKALKPDLFFSMPGPSAPDSKLETIKRIFDDAGFDFYTAHPYTYRWETFGEVVKSFGDSKPIIFSEWGGAVGKLPRLMSYEVRALGSLIQQGRLAGTWFWEWADMTQYGREDISMDGPTLAEGVVTADRNVRDEVFSRLVALYRYDLGEPAPPPRTPVLLPASQIIADANGAYTPIPLQSIAAQQTGDWDRLQAEVAAYWNGNSAPWGGWPGYLVMSGGFWTWDAAQLRIGPVPFETPQIDRHTRPLVVLTGKTVEIPFDGEADRVHFLGNVTVPDGYPTRGGAGEPMGSYTIIYKDGERQENPLRWGLEVARSNFIVSSTQLNPVALLSAPVIDYAKEVSFEQYRTFLYTVRVKHKPIDRIIVSLKPLPSDRPLISLPNQTGSHYAAGDTGLLIYGMTAERKQ
jgi:hypothetical protein